MRIFFKSIESGLSGEMGVNQLLPQKCPKKCPFCPLRVEVLIREFKTSIFGLVTVMLSKPKFHT